MAKRITDSDTDPEMDQVEFLLCRGIWIKIENQSNREACQLMGISDSEAVRDLEIG
jgi:hypothetical protein